jgi:hypothetical protein
MRCCSATASAALPHGPASSSATCANAGLILLYLRHFPDGLLIEVYDTDGNPPAISRPDNDTESGRGLMLVDALSKEWSYFFLSDGGKVVY